MCISSPTHTNTVRSVHESAGTQRTAGAVDTEALRRARAATLSRPPRQHRPRATAGAGGAAGAERRVESTGATD